MRAHVGQDDRGGSHQPLTRVSLGRGEERRASGHFAKLPCHPDRPAVAVNIAALEPSQFSPAQAAEACDQDQCPVTLANRIGQRVDLGDGEDRPLG